MQEGISRRRGTVRPVVEVTRERFEQMVADALDEIPPALGAEMDNVAVVVEEWANARAARTRRDGRHVARSLRGSAAHRGAAR